MNKSNANKQNKAGAKRSGKTAAKKTGGPEDLKKKKTANRSEDLKTEKKTGKKAGTFHGFKTDPPKMADDITLDLSLFPEDDKGNKIVPDDIFEANYRQFPNGTKNASGTFRAYNGGKLGILGADPKIDKEIHRKGAEALNAAHAQRRTLAETIDIMLRKQIDPKLAADLNLPEGVTMQDAVTVALIVQAARGNVKAFATMRDTAGEMPVSKQEITADVMTQADRLLMEKLSRRLDDQ